MTVAALFFNIVNLELEMRRLLVALLFCSPAALFASFEDEEKVLMTWFVEHPEEVGNEVIKVKTQDAQMVSAHHLDDADWATDCLQALTFGAPGPVPAALVAVGVGIATLGVWPALVLAAAGVAHGVEKLAKKVDVRRQPAEQLTFTSQRNHDRYLTARMLILIGGFRRAHAPLASEQYHAVYELYREWASWVGAPLEEKRDVAIDTLALRINKEIHKFKPAKDAT